MKRLFDFLKRNTPSASRAARAFETARRQERNKDYEAALTHYETCAQLYDAAEQAGSRLLYVDRLKAGIAGVRSGRNERALDWLLPVLEAGKYLSEARLHAGYAYAKLGKAQETVEHWSAYPGDPLQPIISKTIREQTEAVKNGLPLQQCCEAVARAWNAQDQHDRRTENMKFKREELIKRRGF